VPPTSACPSCHELISVPRIVGTSSVGRIPMSAQSPCPRCGENLIYSTEGELKDHWRLDRTHPSFAADGP
jgi:predicted RNA-binding Zn-ribbon protein involved in translation (DUF1610 family)